MGLAAEAGVGLGLNLASDGTSFSIENSSKLETPRMSSVNPSLLGEREGEASLTLSRKGVGAAEGDGEQGTTACRENVRTTLTSLQREKNLQQEKEDRGKRS